MQEILTIIQTVGFPIACTIALFIMLQSEEKSHKEEAQELKEAITEMKVTFNNAIHDQQTKVTEAINNNTLVIQKLIDKLEEGDK